MARVDYDRRRNMPRVWKLLWTMGLGNFLLTEANSPNMTKFGNRLRIGLTGVFPNFYIDQNNVIKGSDITALRALSEKMGFEYSISRGSTFDDLVNEVCFDLSFPPK